MIGLDEKQKGLLDRELQVATRKHEKVESVIKKLNDQIDAYRDGVNAATFNHYTVPAN
jgi:phage shock protein A